ncbi:trypsin-like peptidase domain-containing protein [Imperialibacter roseus]|uniref:Trypsin-like peptidase domain-containing protein n=1 Tax=Imperialibacter roseus TaxID=1324217 RepID=A0ABZ0IS86_9BACT|nr:trypsin-like peptidase domain-containing protein [Imperialibacter roseus]WOK07004.1 trypsin-like peptidase domain-containing protein [Imperialibacter roseus]|tara:strand:- start:28751 stop:30220 length:1470 start_codon:yes stop_codon:yes gene_type:complete
MKKFIGIAVLSFLGGIGGAFVYETQLSTKIASNDLQDSDFYFSKNVSHGETNNFSPAASEPFRNDAAAINDLPDLVNASARSTKSVVFVKTVSETDYRTGSWMDWFFGGPSQSVSSGSGVVYSKDGYIVTNNHVINDADIIQVILDKRTYDATLVGTDPSTDLAVIKIEGNNLPAIEVSTSANVRVGDWVLAVGNPFNLTSTVTAGIVSAKGRSINILKDRFPIESFIQTDAAINPGNSGGALVNTSGQLIGINTAILSQTGTYSGYGFAVPVDIVKKVVNDIINYGQVQKAFIGAEFIDIDSDIAGKLSLSNLDGVITSYVQRGSAADKAGLEKGDVIIRVNDKSLNNKTELEELMGYHYPGDKFVLDIKRGDNVVRKQVTLLNGEGNTEVLRSSVYFSEKLGVEFEKVSKVERDLLKIDNGVRVKKIRNGFFRQLDIPEGFIITNINNRPVETPEELANILEKIKGKVVIDGITSKGRRVYIPYRFD